MPHGILFRGGAEAAIRKGLLEEDLIETIIGLPSNLFYGTGIPASIIVFNRSKEEHKKGQVLFINGANDYQEGRTKTPFVIRILRKLYRHTTDGKIKRSIAEWWTSKRSVRTIITLI